MADLLRGMLLASGNDAAVDVALNTAGSEGAFVALMNRAARRLGAPTALGAAVMGRPPRPPPGQAHTTSTLVQGGLRALLAGGGVVLAASGG